MPFVPVSPDNALREDSTGKRHATPDVVYFVPGNVASPSRLEPNRNDHRRATRQIGLLRVNHQIPQGNILREN